MPLIANFLVLLLPNAITATNMSGSFAFLYLHHSVSLPGWSAIVSCSPTMAISCPTPTATTAITDEMGL
jgi:hypothetical protein